MSSKLNTFGSFVGAALVIGIVGWFGATHYLNTSDARLPIKVKRELIKFQSTLPLTVRRGLLLVKFNFTKSSINFTFKIDKLSSATPHPSLVQERLKTFSLIWLCKWRGQFIRKANLRLEVSFVDREDTKIATVVNREEDCEGPIPVIPRKLAS